MNTIEAIKTRRSVGVVSDKPVPKELINEILQCGTWAPNHYKTEPWRFFVLTGEGRKPLGDTLAEIARLESNDITEVNETLLEKARKRPFRAPVIITVAVEPTNGEKVIEIEEYGAVYAAIQNMLLAIHSLGLAAIWRTGKPCYHPLMNERFGLSENGKVLGFIYLGYPQRDLHQGVRKDFNEVTKWISNEDDFLLYKKG